MSLSSVVSSWLFTRGIFRYNDGSQLVPMNVARTLFKIIPFIDQY